MKKLLVIIFSAVFLLSCSMGGFKPPKVYYLWRFNHAHLANQNTNMPILDILDRRENDMRACGMDPVRGESGSAKINLCLEQKGWYLDGGPVCENKLMWNEPECIKWRAKYSKPDAKPWG